MSGVQKAPLSPPPIPPPPSKKKDRREGKEIAQPKRKKTDASKVLPLTGSSTSVAPTVSSC